MTSKSTVQTDLARATQKITKFKVSINKPPTWKINAIARYKYKQNLKVKNEVNNNDMKANTTSENNELNSEKYNSNNRSSSSRNNNVSFPTLSEISQMSTINGIDKKLLSYTNEQIQTEIDILHRSSLLVKKEVKSLNNVRNSLLWLLSKASSYDNMRNHSTK
jgi:hypothetical protein